MRSLMFQIRREVSGAHGPLGRVTDVYFDDRSWTVLWFVVRLAGASGEEVLVPPQELEFKDASPTGLHWNGTGDSLIQYPLASSRLPVSRQKLVQLSQTVLWTSSPFPLIFHPPKLKVPSPSYLRSCVHVKNYEIWPQGEPKGRIDDFLWDPKTARIVAFRVRRGWWRRKIGALVPTEPGARVSWADFRVYAGETRAAP